MSDIVKRLRDWDDIGPEFEPKLATKEMREAADTIESLRLLVGEMSKQLQRGIQGPPPFPHYEDWEKQVRALIARAKEVSDGK